MKINNTTLIIGAIVVVGGFLWYRNRRKNENNETDSSSGGGGASALNQAISKPIKPINFSLKPMKIVDNTNASMPTPRFQTSEQYQAYQDKLARKERLNRLRIQENPELRYQDKLARREKWEKGYFVGDID